MKTKIVYVLVSADNDIYLEQVIVSVFSLLHHNPEAHVELVADKETSDRVNKHELLKSAINNIVSVDFDKAISNKERSRWLKTNLRNYIEGDFLFLDTDTIVTNSIADVDEVVGDVAITLDLHCHFSSHPFYESISKKITRLFGVQLKDGTDYYNSGVMLVRDTLTSHRFFNRWHELWLQAKDMKGGVQDQQSLAVAINEMGTVKPLPGKYNCQVLGSVEFLNRAKIVHFFNTKWSGGLMSPFFDQGFYEDIKCSGYISAEKEWQILHCRDYFVSPSMMVGLEDMRLWLTPTFRCMRNTYRMHKTVFAMIDRFSKLVLYVGRQMGGVKMPIRK